MTKNSAAPFLQSMKESTQSKPNYNNKKISHQSPMKSYRGKSSTTSVLNMNNYSLEFFRQWRQLKVRIKNMSIRMLRLERIGKIINRTMRKGQQQIWRNNNKHPNPYHNKGRNPCNNKRLNPYNNKDKIKNWQKREKKTKKRSDNSNTRRSLHKKATNNNKNNNKH